MDNDYYKHMERDLESDLVDYIMGLWHMHRMAKMSNDYKGAIKLKGTTK